MSETANTPSGPDSPTSSSDTQNANPESPYAEEEISLLDLLVVLAQNRRFVIGCIATLTFLGLIYAVVAPEQYTSSAEMVREVEGGSGSVPGGVSALRGLGINLGGGATGLTAETYPRILTSREVMLAVVRDTFYFADEEQEMRFVDYHAEQGTGILAALKKYTIGLPGQLLSALKGEPRQRPVETLDGDRQVYPTEEEEEAMEIISDMVNSSVDVESGIMTVSVTDYDPVRAAEITDSFLQHLTERVRTIRTQKARDNLAFINERFEEAKDELEAAEQRLAAFSDRNRDIQSARLRTERDRLQRQVRFASNLYSEFQTQRTQAQIELQRSQPVITILEAPTPPLKRSAPQRTLLVLLSMFLGGLVGIGGAFARTFFTSQNDEEEQEKLEQIKAALHDPLGRNAS
jgi:uncharacterized protein involved in exopolysaccharide biosynthesis